MAVQFQDYYRILDVPRTATPDQIKKAFRQFAKIHHPDVARDKARGEAKFREILEAYEVLGDPLRRRQYDELRDSWQKEAKSPRREAAPPGDPLAANFPPPRRYRVNFEESEPSPVPAADFSDFFKTYFARGSDQTQVFRDKARPDDPRYPFAPRKSARWFYRTATGEEKGPYELLELAALLRCGDITPTTAMRTEGDLWAPFRQRPEFKWARDMPAEVVFSHLKAKKRVKWVIRPSTVLYFVAYLAVFALIAMALYFTGGTDMYLLERLLGLL